MEITNNVLVRVDNADIIGGMFNIPDGITSIGNWAFEDCTSLKSIAIPKSVMTIGNYAFNCCISLTSLVIPDSVISIGNYTFYYCTSLTSIAIPKSVTSIGDYAFYGCSGLKSISIPNSVTTIGYRAFEDCTSLESPNINKSDIIDLAISLLPVHVGLCSCLDEATRIMSLKCGRAINVQTTFPNFKHKIAIAEFGARKAPFWWPVVDKASRISFLEWLRNN